MSDFKKAVGYTLLGTGAAVLVAQPFALAKDYTADIPEVPGLSFTAGTAVGTASLSNSSMMSVRIPDTILDDREYEARFGGLQWIYTWIDRD